ncbi:endonuclease/exonuclease/phosphatase family protein [Paenibacillus mesophilus]|uniref:endonuclease/exonuclease/phosphatase family protein n=1 Tax=Paenibacillus mesophilus TaxID=2582849 RepID=UPI001305102B|nr:endonuclease/exonuclease/phosphatase family protein [Paenibacillus mesophilus]
MKLDGKPVPHSPIVKVMSYNVHSGIGMDGRYDMDRLASVIGESGADIVGLQEVDVYWGGRSHHEDMVGELAAKLGMHTFFAPIYELDATTEGEPARQFGVALLSRFPVIQAINHNMTRLSTQEKIPEPRPFPGLAEVRLNVDGYTLTIYVTHLDYRTDPAIRLMQVGELLDIAGSEPVRKLIVGDFNARPDAPELLPLFAVFPDTWAEVRRVPGYTFPADVPDRKIDYILAGSGFEVVRTDVVDTGASDHRPLIAELRIC